MGGAIGNKIDDNAFLMPIGIIATSSALLLVNLTVHVMRRRGRRWVRVIQDRLLTLKERMVGLSMSRERYGVGRDGITPGWTVDGPQEVEERREFSSFQGGRRGGGSGMLEVPARRGEASYGRKEGGAVYELS